MATYIALINWTDQGVKNAGDSVSRYQEARTAFEPLGIQFQSAFWTTGQYDVVVVLEAPDDETLSVAILKLAAQGNTRTQTFRAFNEEEMKGIAEKLG